MNYKDFLVRAKAMGGKTLLRTRNIFYIFDERYCTIKRNADMEKFIAGGGLNHLADMKYASIEEELEKIYAATDSDDRSMFNKGVEIDCAWCGRMLAQMAAKFGVKALFMVDCQVVNVDMEKFESVFGATK